MHNLYFPWIRIIIFSILFSIPFFTRDFFKIEISIPFPFPSKSYFPVENLSVKESDLQEYEIASKERSSNIEYTINGSNRKLGNLIAIEPNFLALDFYSAENFNNSLKPLFEKSKNELCQIYYLLEVFNLNIKERNYAEAENQIKLNETLNVEREKIRKQEDDKNELKFAALQKQLEDQKKLTEEMKRKQEQGSMQLQGEVMELAIEEWLASDLAFQLMLKLSLIQY